MRVEIRQGVPEVYVSVVLDAVAAPQGDAETSTGTNQVFRPRHPTAE